MSKGVREIARALGRDPGTISRELRRNAATRGGKQEYRATVAQWKAQQAAKRPKSAKLLGNDRLREYVQERLSGNVHRPDGTVVTGPQTPPWKGLNKPYRQDRRWATAWSPEQISHRLKADFPEDESMRISHEAIYQSLFIEGRGALKRELVACLRTGRALREPRSRSRNKPQGHVTADVVLSERPAEAGDRAVPGHWEGDLIIGTGRSAIGTLVERSSRSTLLVHLPRVEGGISKSDMGKSMGRVGSCHGNAAAESFFAVLKEEIGARIWSDRATVRAEVFAFIETFYNHRACAKTPGGAISPHSKSDSDTTKVTPWRRKRTVSNRRVEPQMQPHPAPQAPRARIPHALGTRAGLQRDSAPAA
ncbi:hypothetical protein KCMC57_up63370 [Kitasatospora sp. CMC57]|uniref:Transposase IS30-like HTH domain-containing protein n=1 Tax=Kitasatospora sp. CMC57 TaxID=3231513 RepID=A0AB33K6X8_9ACTN